MHSSTMRTVRNSSRLLGGGGCLVPGGRGVPGQEGACSGGVPAPGGDGIPACTPEADRQTDRCNNITFATSLRTVKIYVVQLNIMEEMNILEPPEEKLFLEFGRLAPGVRLKFGLTRFCDGSVR